jgi:hypothetical protein
LDTPPRKRTSNSPSRFGADCRTAVGAVAATAAYAFAELLPDDFIARAGATVIIESASA